MPSCTHCGSSFDSAHALQVHVGRMHKSAATKKGVAGGKKRKRRGRPPGRPKGVRSGTSSLARVSTADLAAELRRRAELADRLKNLLDAS